MKTRLGNAAVWALLAMVVGTAVGAVPSGPLKHPKRVVEGHTVDLAPLFRWWTNQSGARPLTSWVRVTGPVMATNALGWVIAAHPEHPSARARGSAGEAPADGQWRILLKHPPRAEAAEFASLQARLKELNAERQRLDAGVKAASQTHLAGRRARVRAEEMRESKKELQTLDLQIRDCRAKLAAYPDPDKFKVDCLALDVGQDQGILPIYDCGAILSASP